MTDRGQIEAQLMIPRLLAGQLSAAEESAFDEFAREHPEIYRDVERALRFKEGLAALRDQGKLHSLVRTRSWRSYIHLAAAAVVLLACGTLVWTRFREPTPVVLASATADFVRSSARTAPLVGSYILARSREATSPIDLELPARRGITQLRLLPSSSTDQHYNARLIRLASTDGRQLIGELHGLALSRMDLYVTVYIDSSNLPPGDYEVSLEPQSATSVDAHQDRFILRLPGR
jgi:hypothetical protein